MSEKSEVHSIRFSKDHYTTATARKGLKSHGYKPIKRVDITENQYRYRIKDPSLFKRFITKVEDDGKIHFVIGYY